jgi:hypothetical protein
MFNDVKTTYKSSVEKSEFLLDSFYLRYENDDSFRSVRNDDEDDQSVKINQLMRMQDQNSKDENSEDENSDSENSKDSNHQEDNLIETLSSAESLTEMQSVRENLTLLSTDLSQSVKIAQIASFYAAEKTLIVSANQDNDDNQFVLTNDSDSNETKNSINQKTNNCFISKKNNALILNYSRSKIKHDYKQLHHKNFVKAAKSIKSIADHDLIILKTFEQIINDSQTKK